MQSALKQKLYDFLQGCQPTAGLLSQLQSQQQSRGSAGAVTVQSTAGVVIIDEIEKMAPGSLDDLVSIMSRRGVVSRPVKAMHTAATMKTTALATTNTASSNHSGDQTIGDSSLNTTNAVADVDASRGAYVGAGGSVSYATNNLVFILISDIGVEEMTSLLLRYGDRSTIPLSVLRTQVKGALDKQWGRLNFNKAVTGIVPFLPLEPVHIQEITMLKIRKLSAQYQYKYWLKLHVDTDLVTYLSSASFISYKKHSMVLTGGVNMLPESGVHNPTGVASKLIAEFGARSIENAGPLQDLKKYLYRYMQPWRAHQVLHVGLAQLTQLSAGTYYDHGSDDGGKQLQVYFQWCYVHELMWRPITDSEHSRNDSDAASVPANDDNGVCDTAVASEDLNEIHVDAAISFSQLCETIWYGPFNRFN